MNALTSLHFPESHLQIYRNLAQSVGVRLEQAVDLSPGRFTTLVDGSKTFDGTLLKDLLRFTRDVAPPGVPPSLNMLRHLEFTAHGWLGVAVTAMPNMQNAIELYIKYQSLIMPAVLTEAHLKATSLELHFKPQIDLGDLTPILMENVMGCMGLMKNYLDSPLVARRVYFTHSPLGELANYADFSDGEHLFNQNEYKIILDKQVLDYKITTRNISLAAQLVNEVERRHSELPGAFSSKVYRLLTKEAENGHFLRQEELADHFNMSTRTLTRRLSKEGLSYKNMVRDLKMMLAKNLLLKKANLSIEQVSARTGFSSSAAFIRAFKKYFNKTPQEFRKQ